MILNSACTTALQTQINLSNAKNSLALFIDVTTHVL